MARKTRQPAFEEALEELETITRSLESGELSLDDSIQAYEKGMELRKICLQILESAEKKLEYLERSESGSLEVKEFENESAVERSDGVVRATDSTGPASEAEQDALF